MPRWYGRCQTEPWGFRTAPSASQLRDFVRGWRLAGYRYGADSHDRKQLVVSRQAPNLDAVIAATTATIAARDLVNTPSNIKNPQWMVGQARAVGRAVGAEVEVLGVPQLRAGGFGGCSPSERDPRARRAW